MYAILGAASATAAVASCQLQVVTCYCSCWAIDFVCCHRLMRWQLAWTQHAHQSDQRKVKICAF